MSSNRRRITAAMVLKCHGCQRQNCFAGNLDLILQDNFEGCSSVGKTNSQIGSTYWELEVQIRRPMCFFAWYEGLKRDVRIGRATSAEFFSNSLLACHVVGLRLFAVPGRMVFKATSRDV